MAGKSNKSKNKVKASNSTTPDIPIHEPKTADTLITSKDETPDASAPSSSSVDNLSATKPADPSLVSNNLVGENAKSVEETQPPNRNQAESELRLYPVSVKSQTGEKLELQLSPGDSVMDVRQFLLDAPETCFFTCYDMILHTKDDGALHHLEDYNEISEIADITTGGCSIEMVPSMYDDRSIRSHIRRTRDLLSLSNHQPSLSTSFGLQHEATQKTDAGKTEAPELEEIGFMDDVSGSVCNLFPELPNDIVCIQSLVFSSFNPPPSYRRLVGDLIYIDVVTLEGTKLCITGRTKSFYVNSSTGNVLDPRPSKMNSEATTLIGLLQKLSPKFKIRFHEILERKALSHPFENVQSLLPPNLWTGVYPVPDHKRDAARAEDAFSLSYGTEFIGMQRDWNEELQSCREFPHLTPQERILRDRALYKVTCDFVDAAISGAVGVINRCIQPINPTDPECFHMYVHNNIFFSFAVDADIGQISKEQSSSSKQKLWKDPRVLCNFQISEEASVNVLNGNGHSRSVSTNSNKPKDDSEITSDAHSEAQFVDSEQATYASANNDLKGTKAYQEADISGLYNLAMAIIDYRGHRVVAQSIIPGILQGDKSDSLLYGSVDNGKKIAWNESFHSKVLEAAKHLHIKEHTVLDGAGKSVKLAAPVECKGIVGSDNRHYILDLMRATPRDVNFNGPNSRFCVLRPELITSFCQTEAETMSKRASNGAVDAPAESVIPTSEDIGSLETSEKNPKSSVIITEKSSSTICENTSEEILLNPNVFTEFKIAGTEEEIDSDEKGVKKATAYLVEVVLPKFVKDLCSLEVSPMDGQTLTDALHAHGINIRYLGKIANDIKHLPHLWDIFTTEIIVRSAKHIIKEILRESQDQDLAPAVSHFLNCFTGSVSPGNTKEIYKKDNAEHTPGRKSNKKSQSGAASQSNHSAAYMLLTTDSLWSHIQEFAKSKYQFELPEEARSRVKKLFVIRNLCLKMGISIVARKYNFEVASPFKILDICNLLPVVKHSVPSCSEAKDLIENGKARLTEGLLNEAYTIFSEAFSLLQQVTGPMHRDVANCCRYLAMVLYHAGDMAGAIMQQHKELIINERCLGLDHPDTAHSYGNMALFYHGLNQTQLSMRHMSRTLLLLSLSSGPEHPDVASTFINVAMMYQDAGKMNTALRYLQEALKKNERLLGPEHIQTGVCYHALAIAFNCIGAYKLSFQHETKTHEIFNKQLGSDDLRTRDSENWVKTFKMRDVQVNAQKQKMQSIDASSAQKTIEMLKANPDLLQAFQNAAVRSSKSTISPRGDTLPRGRGVDERAARAATEIRKKAAARGVPVHTHSVPVQATPDLSQIRNIMNSSAVPDASSMAPKKGNVKASSSSDGATIQNQNNASVINSNDRAPAPPVGLGAGLSPKNDQKKQKAKKVTAS